MTPEEKVALLKKAGVWDVIGYPTCIDKLFDLVAAHEREKQAEQEPVIGAYEVVNEKGDEWSLVYPAAVHRYKSIPEERITQTFYAAPVRTKDLTEKWIDPNDKSQKQYLPHIGEKVLFCCDGEVYYGHHTGGSFQKGYGVTKSLFPTWDCMWMHLPAAVIAADREKNK